MSYPLSESFATAPATGYTPAVLGGMSATHNGAQQSIDISAPNAQSILRFNEAAHGDFWFEADIELLTDRAPASVGLVDDRRPWLRATGSPISMAVGVSAGTVAFRRQGGVTGGVKWMAHRLLPTWLRPSTSASG